MFRLGASVMEAMNAGVAVDPLARYFEYWLLKLQGVYQRDPSLSGDALAFLDAARVSSPQDIDRVSVSRAALRELEAAHRAVIAMHLERDLRSTSVLSSGLDEEGAITPCSRFFSSSMSTETRQAGSPTATT